MLDTPYTTSGQKQPLLPTHILQRYLPSQVHSPRITKTQHMPSTFTYIILSQTCKQETQTTTGTKIGRLQTHFPSRWNDRSHTASTRNHIKPCSFQPITLLRAVTCFVMKQSVLFNTDTKSVPPQLCTSVNDLLFLIQSLLCYKQIGIQNTWNI
jgi:hypothetical protein